MSTEVLQLHSIARYATFQVRKQLDMGTVQRYAQALEAGADFPAVKVGRIKAPDVQPRGRPSERLKDVQPGALVLLDGFHRVEAHRIAGQLHILADVIEVTAKDAQWEAARANLMHGLPLKPKEIVEAFKAYVRAGQYRDAKGNLKSLRTIGKEFGRPHTTIRRWLERAKFYRLLALYDKEKTPALTQRTEEEQHPMDRTTHDIREALVNARALAPALSPQQRGELLAALVDLKATLEAAGAEDPEF
jgi:hypothetical protein